MDVQRFFQIFIAFLLSLSLTLCPSIADAAPEECMAEKSAAELAEEAFKRARNQLERCNRLQKKKRKPKSNEKKVAKLSHQLNELRNVQSESEANLDEIVSKVAPEYSEDELSDRATRALAEAKEELSKLIASFNYPGITPCPQDSLCNSNSYVRNKQLSNLWQVDTREKLSAALENFESEQRERVLREIEEADAKIAKQETWATNSQAEYGSVPFLCSTNPQCVEDADLRRILIRAAKLTRFIQEPIVGDAKGIKKLLASRSDKKTAARAKRSLKKGERSERKLKKVEVRLDTQIEKLEKRAEIVGEAPITCEDIEREFKGAKAAFQRKEEALRSCIRNYHENN